METTMAGFKNGTLAGYFNENGTETDLVAWNGNS